MNKEIRHIIIKHLNGSKANQIEEFDYQANDTISFGRATHNDLQFDSQEDNAVSREHGNISKGESFGSFIITDKNSLNGTYVNGQKVNGSQSLNPGDEISLGAKGPRFQFDLNPRMSDSAATQLINIPAADATMEYNLETEVEPVKDGIGKETFERAIVTERKRSQKTLISVVAAVLLVATTLGYTFKDKLLPANNISGTKDTIVVKPDMPVIPTQFSPEVIARENTDKVVFIEFGFKLIHAPTGDDIYHQYTRQKDPKTGKEYLMPLFIEMEQGVIEPLLGLRKDVEEGAPIAMSQLSGTGFIVDEDGYILTNKHIAEPWKYPYSFPPEAAQGMLYQFVNGEWKITGTVRAPSRWIPSETKFFGREPISGKILDGQRTYMNVTFAKTDSRINARFVQSSPNHDVAMLKIDHTASFESVELKEDGYEVAQGQKIAVMGYPGISPAVVYGRATREFGRSSSEVKIVPDPTITDGTIGKIIRGSNMVNNAELNAYYSPMGEYYQLTASETGSGNSGGPVFDKDGKVIAIFAASTTSQEGARITFAIPIKYGLDLMHLNPVIQ
ncbi:MAG: trypsin-like peptidase domain-containing protein [Bacteroidota bacterium]